MVPHLAFPLTIGPGGSFNVVQQDTEAEVTQSVAMLLGTEIGERPMVPTYGVTDPTFSDIDADELVSAVSRWEPRAAVTISVTNDGAGTADVDVDVSLAQSSTS